MMKTAMASAAVLGAVMVAPAQAVSPPAEGPRVEDTINIFAFADVYNAWKAAWAPWFGSTPTVLSAGPFSVAVLSGTFDSQVLTRSFTALTSGANVSVNFAMPVPGPIAGAGLPLLAAGIAFAAWRRRRAANAA